MRPAGNGGHYSTSRNSFGYLTTAVIHNDSACGSSPFSHCPQVCGDAWCCGSTKRVHSCSASKRPTWSPGPFGEISAVPEHAPHHSCMLLGSPVDYVHGGAEHQQSEHLCYAPSTRPPSRLWTVVIISQRRWSMPHTSYTRDATRQTLPRMSTCFPTWHREAKGGSSFSRCNRHSQ